MQRAGNLPLEGIEQPVETQNLDQISTWFMHEIHATSSPLSKCLTRIDTALPGEHFQLVSGVSLITRALRESPILFNGTIMARGARSDSDSDQNLETVCLLYIFR
jgi:hypothetical protein